MNLTQNDRLNQVTANTLIVGVDVGSKTHFCRAFDWRGFELSSQMLCKSEFWNQHQLLQLKCLLLLD